MAEVAHLSYDQVNAPPDHRQLLASLNSHGPDDSDTEPEGLSDDPSAIQHQGGAFVDDDFVGVAVSIGRVQTYLRSPKTPAVEKSRILSEHDDYFLTTSPNKEAREVPSDVVTPTLESDTPVHQQAAAEPGPLRAQDSAQLPSPWKAHPRQSQRSSLLRSVLGESSGEYRGRSLSGTMLANFKSYFPDLPSFDLLKSYSSPLANQKVAPSYAGTRGSDAATLRPRVKLAADHEESATSSSIVRQRSRSTAILHRQQLDGGVESVLTPVTSASSRRHHRSNSDSSLYLNRKPTGISAYDDTSTYADVTEMVNSRFKAITDSFQNSTLRLPKLPSIKPNTKNFTLHQGALSDEATRYDNPTKTDLPAQGGRYHYTNIRNIRNAKNKQMAEHVQTPQQRAHPVLSEALSGTEGDIIILGGYRGSILRDAKPPHRQLWAPVKVGLNLRSADLELGLTREEEERASEKIIASGTLSHVGPIDICRRLLKHLRRCPNAREGRLRVHDYGYDWRLSPELLSQRLIDFVEGLESNQPHTEPASRGAVVIAHSSGGLLTRYAVNKRPELFAGVVYAGVPQNCVNILGPLRNGDDVLLSSRVLTAQVNFTMRTSFLLLPEDGKCFIQKHTNERYDLNFFDLRVWDEYRLSPCIKPALCTEPRSQQHKKSMIGTMSDSMTSAFDALPSIGTRGSWFGMNSREESPSGASSTSKDAAKDTAENVASALNLAETPENTPGESSLEPSMKKGSNKSSIATAVTIPPAVAKEYLERTLAEILAFKKALVHKEELQYANKYPPHAFIFGKSVPTVYGARVASREAIKYSDAFDDLAFAAGDGVVLASAAQLPDGYKCVKDGRVETDRGHVGLLGDLEGVGKCLSAIVLARKRGVGWGNYDMTDKGQSSMRA